MRAPEMLLVLAVLCRAFLPLESAWWSVSCRAAGLSDAIGNIGGGLLPGHVGSALKAAVQSGKSFEDITPEQEYYIGRAVGANILAAYRPWHDERLNLYVNTLGQTLAQASDRPDTFGGYHFLVLDSPEINAFAAPGGLIFVTRGMIRVCRTEDALAAVLAHEISHVVGKHGLKAIKRGRLTNAFAIMANEAMKSYGPAQLSQLTAVFGGSITDITATLMKSGYSRQLEGEADRGAAAILMRFGYDPNAMIVMLEEMKKQLRPGGLDFAKTHPDPEERIKQIRPIVAGVAASSAPALRQKRFEAAVSNL